MSNIYNQNSSSVQNEFVSLFFHKTTCDTSKWKLTTCFMEKGRKSSSVRNFFCSFFKHNAYFKVYGYTPCNHAIFTKGDNL